MPVSGTLLNVATVLLGTAVGVLIGRRMPARMQESLTTGLGFFSYLGTPLNDGDHFFVSGSEFLIQYNGGTGNDVVLQAVPEPGSALLLLGGVALLQAGRKRRRSA